MIFHGASLYGYHLQSSAHHVTLSEHAGCPYENIRHCRICNLDSRRHKTASLNTENRLT